MTVRKVVVNPAGAVDADAEFVFTPDPRQPWVNPSEVQFVLVHGAERGVCTDNFSQGYTVVESAHPDYNTTSACTGDLPGGTNGISSASGSSVTFRPDNPSPGSFEQLICEFTNTRKTGQLRVEKRLDPSSDPGKFDLQIDGVTRRVDSGHGQGVTVTVETGQHTVGELAGAGTNLSDYSSAIECRDPSGGLVKDGTGTSLSGIPVAESEQITCTITNKLKPPTAVRLASFTARREARGIRIYWRTAHEAGLAGFHLYREQRGRQTRVNARLITAAGAATGRRYALLDRTSPRHGPVRYLLQAVAVDGTRSWYGSVTARR